VTILRAKHLLTLIIICLTLAPLSYGEAGHDLTLPEKIQYTWTMDTAGEIRTFTSDNTEAAFELETGTVFEGKGACKVVPSGKCEETKLIVDLTKHNKEWEDKTRMVVNVYVPEGCPVNTCFAFVGRYWPKWEWVDAAFSWNKIQKTGGWTQLVFPITGKMQQLKSTKYCKLYLTFWYESAPNVKVPLLSSTPFYVDGIAFID
jgi:hypothetical protein